MCFQIMSGIQKSKNIYKIQHNEAYWAFVNHMPAAVYVYL